MAEATRKTSRKRQRRQGNRRVRFRLVTCVLLALLLSSPAQAITITFGDIEITPQPSPRGLSSHGYSEYVFHLVNKSAEHSHIVSLSMPFEKAFANGDSIRDLRRTVQVGAQETVHVSLLQPDHPPLAGADVAVTIDGRRQEREVHLRPSESTSFSGARYLGSHSSAERLILVSPGVKPLPTTAPVPGGMMEGMPGGFGGIPAVPRPAMPARAPPKRLPTVRGGPPGSPPRRPPAKPGLPPRGYQFVNDEIWSGNWLAYSRYDGVIVTAAVLNELPAATRTALWQYVETGGALLVLGPSELHGLSARTNMEKDKAGWLKATAGFGTCRISPDANYDSWDVEHFTVLMNDWTNTAMSWGGKRSTISANEEFPIIDDLGIPIKGLFVLMFLFTLGIGPINVWVLSRLKRRIWLLWTTPAFSLCTCLAVLGYMLVSEGWQGRLRTETLTLLDETTHRATTIGWTGVYSPLTPGDGLHFSYDTMVVPQRYFEGRRSGARSCTIDWSQDQHFASGWVEARVPAHFKVRKSELRRERVALQREPDGRWSMVNGLGAAIRRFWYADAKGQIHMAEIVAPGARALLTLTEMECQGQANAMRSLLSGPNKLMSNRQMVVRNPQHYLHAGLYLAEVDDSPFLEDALRNAGTRKLHAIVVGFGKQGD